MLLKLRWLILTFTLFCTAPVVAFDRKVIKDFPEIDPHRIEVQQYLSRLNESGMAKAIEGMDENTLRQMKVAYFRPKYPANISMHLKSHKIVLKNWSLDRCTEVLNQLTSAKQLFRKFQKLSKALGRLLNKKVVDSHVEKAIYENYEEMIKLKNSILEIYPETFDNLEIHVGAQWQFPKNQVFTDPKAGILFSPSAIMSSVFMWESDSTKISNPQDLVIKQQPPLGLTILIKTVPAIFCSSDFQFRGFGHVVGTQMNTIGVELSFGSF